MKNVTESMCFEEVLNEDEGREKSVFRKGSEGIRSMKRGWNYLSGEEIIGWPWLVELNEK